MCNLYRMKSGRAEVAGTFAAVAVGAAGNAPDEIYPGYPGLVVADGQLQQMSWGFPFARVGAKGQPLKPKPVNNARSDKLAGPFWKASFIARRCLIPVTQFAEAEGQRGAMTRTWMSLPDAPLFAVGGLWRDTDEWGRAYAMVITDACPAIAPVHHRMPVILHRDDWETWQHGPPADAHALSRPWQGAITIDRTDEPWTGRR